MGCANVKVAPHNKILKSPNGSTAHEGSVEVSGLQLADQETLKNFNILPQHFVRKNSGKITSDYTILSPPLGRGAFGEVRKAHHNASGITRAIKIIARRHADKDQQEILMNEVSILKNLDHPQIMKVLEFYRDKNFFYIVSEYCAGGDLYERMKNTTFSETRAAKVMYQLLTGVSYLHANGVVHRDLKPENLLYESTSDDANLKIADFGASRALRKGTKLHSTVGTILYIAPEVLKNSYTEKCDIWSCGVILYTLLCGRPPFYGKNEKEVEEKILKGSFVFHGREGTNISKEAKIFITKLLTYNPADRPTAVQAIRDPWIVKIMFQNKKLTKKNLAVGQSVMRNLAHYSAGRKFQDAVWVFLVNYFLAESDKKKLQEVFAELDEDKDGLLSHDDVLRGYEKYNLVSELGDEGEVDEIINRIDRNKNGSIDYTEFVIATINKKKLLAKNNLEATFKLIDRDESKAITVDELKDFFAGQGQQEWDDKVWEALLREVDENSDGQITYSEFKTMMFKML